MVTSEEIVLSKRLSKAQRANLVLIAVPILSADREKHKSNRSSNIVVLTAFLSLTETDDTGDLLCPLHNNTFLIKVSRLFYLLKRGKNHTSFFTRV